MNQLKKWNGRAPGGSRGSVYVAAYTALQAREILMLVFKTYLSTNEIREYFSPCWGDPMKGVEPTEPSVYYSKNYETPQLIFQSLINKVPNRATNMANATAKKSAPAKKTASKAASKAAPKKAAAKAAPAVDKGPGKIAQIIEWHKKGLSNAEIVEKGFNKTTVSIQVSKFKNAKADKKAAAKK